MTRNLNKELKKYYRDISKALSGSKEKKAIIAQIKSSVNNYLEENQNATIYDVVKRIGFPEQIADEYIDNQSNDEISAKIKVGKRILIAVCVVLAAALLIYICVMLDAINQNHGQFEEQAITTISITDI